MIGLAMYFKTNDSHVEGEDTYVLPKGQDRSYSWNRRRAYAGTTGCNNVEVVNLLNWTSLLA